MSNHLVNEKSPYLLQHVKNPVDWHPWSLDVFAQAQAEDKVVFLSIGYATCHWCHVMERESFEDKKIADFLNQNFLSIKLDREERPDIDQIYMRALHSMGQQGGWPLNIFLTPERLPITGGTYFPPKAMYGRPSFLEVLEAIHKAWQKDRPKLLQSAQTIFELLAESNQKPRHPNPIKIAWEDVQEAISQMKRIYDPYNAGFLGNGANKFPPSLQLLFFLAYYRKAKDKESLEMVEQTLDRMKRGGIYDQLGGGLSRYSTDHDWFLPHFEKMLYDNALFLWVLLDCYRLTKKERYKIWAMEVIQYIERDMIGEEGGFCCAEDADSEGEEGKFYLWTYSEIQEVLEEAGLSLKEQRHIFDFWGVRVRGNFEGKNILHEVQERESFLQSIAYSQEEWEVVLTKARQALLKRRNKRVRPLRDDKIICAWNAYMISALAQASALFQKPDLALRAKQCADFLWEKLRDEEENLYRRYREGEACFPANLGDYAALGNAFVDLYRANFEVSSLERAFELSKKILEKFSATDGAFYDSAKENNDLIFRSRDPFDGVEPSGNALLARLFFSLSRYGLGASHYKHCLEYLFTHFANSAKENPNIHPYLWMLYSYELLGESELVILDDSTSLQEETKKALSFFRKNTSAEQIICLGKANDTLESTKAIPLLYFHYQSKSKETSLSRNKVDFYLCQNQSCQNVVHSLEDLEKLWKKKSLI